MKILESVARIILVTGIFLIWLTPLLPTLARATEYEKPKPQPPVVVTQPAAQDSHDRRLENALGAAAVSGLATAAMRGEQYGAVKAFGITVVGAAAIEAAHSGSFESKNLAWAIGGAAIGSVGTCAIYFRKSFVGCAVPFK